MPFRKSGAMTIHNSTLQTIGRTPVVRLLKLTPPDSADIYVKLEYFNPTGSYKDRMALAMIEEAEQRGDLRAGMTVVEYTGGSTGSSLAFVCAQKGYPLKVVSSDAFAAEKLNTMRAFGADLTIVPSDNGQIKEQLFIDMIATARAIAAEPGHYWTDQFNNRDSLEGYKNIGRELAEQFDGKIDVFCAAVGTAGMLMGVSQALKAAGMTTRVVALEPASSPVLSQGTQGAHRVEGIGIGYVPPLLDPAFYDEAQSVDEAEARATARRMAREEGIFGGTSSGLNVLGALQLARSLGKGHKVVTVAVDSGLKYLAGDLYKD